jgi:hypothetical protein
MGPLIPSTFFVEKPISARTARATQIYAEFAQARPTGKLLTATLMRLTVPGSPSLQRVGGHVLWHIAHNRRYCFPAHIGWTQPKIDGVMEYGDAIR